MWLKDKPILESRSAIFLQMRKINLSILSYTFDVIYSIIFIVEIFERQYKTSAPSLHYSIDTKYLNNFLLHEWRGIGIYLNSSANILYENLVHKFSVSQISVFTSLWSIWISGVPIFSIPNLNSPSKHLFNEVGRTPRRHNWFII